jgi:hypothetical protein
MARIKTQNKAKQSKAAKKGKAGKKQLTKAYGVSPDAFRAAQLSPWHPSAIGAKFPDFDNNPSIASTFTQSIPVGTNADGRVCIALPFHPSNLACYATVLADQAVLYGSTPIVLTDMAALMGGWEKACGIRVVGAGVRVTPMLNANNATGRIYLAPMPVMSMKMWASAAGQQYSEGDIGQMRGMHKTSLSHLAATDSTLTFRSSLLDASCMHYIGFQNPLATSIDYTDYNNITGCLLYITGAPANITVADLEVVVHYEWIPSKAFDSLVTPPMPSNTGFLERVINASERAPNVIESVASGALRIAGAVGRIAPIVAGLF